MIRKMSRTVRRTFSTIILSMILAIASVAMGAMHGVPASDDLRLEAFLASGGQVSDICGDMDHGKMPAGECVFCLSNAATLLPVLVKIPEPVARLYAADFVASRENRTVRPVRDPALGLRGPPHFA